jgi:uncharacterized membrane protein YfcA
MTTQVDQRRLRLAFLYSAPIGVLGGLIGLGGAEYRLPVLAGPLGYPARRAVPLNLVVSFVTLAIALITRGRTLTVEALLPLLDAVLSLASGAVVAAFFGAALASRLSNERLERLILVLLAGIGLALIAEGFLPEQLPGFLPGDLAWRVSAGLAFGLGIGLVSTLLGVAGGELIIPTLIFAFGADVKTAGTAGLFVSLPTVLVGVMRYAAGGAYSDRRAWLDTVAPMSLGSIIGAVVGGLLVGWVPASILKIGLGLILNISAWRIFRGAATR